MDIMSAIRHDHERLIDLLEALTDQDDHHRLLVELHRRFKAHVIGVTTYVHPTVFDCALHHVDRTERIAHEYRRAQQKISLTKQTIGTKDYDATLEDLAEIVNTHIEEEEDEVLPAIHAAVTTATFQAMGLAYRDRQRAALDCPPDTPSVYRPIDHAAHLR